MCIYTRKWWKNTIKKSKEKLQKEAGEKNQNLSEEEKEKKHQYHCDRKQKEVQYMGHYYLAQKK